MRGRAFTLAEGKASGVAGVAGLFGVNGAALKGGGVDGVYTGG